MLFLILAVAFLVLFVLIFRAPAPRIDKLIYFLLLLGVTAILGYMFAVHILDFDPDPMRLSLARRLTDNKIVDFTQFVPGLPPNLDLIHRLDVDLEEEEQKEEWLVFYRYDEVVRDERVVAGPFGAAIYDMDKCRPPAVLSYELAPENYDYLSLDTPRIDDVLVANIIPHQEEYDAECLRQGTGPDRPELVIFGRTNGVRTDLNIFRKTGQDLTCIERQQWEDFYEDSYYPCPLTYENIGSWRGNYRVELNGNLVTTYDRSPFERSVLVIKRVYEPNSMGTYFQPPTEPGAGKVLRDPKEVGIVFGPGAPENTKQVYYPEKTVMAFFLQLGKDTDAAMENVCEVKGSRRNYDPQDFGLTLPERDLERVTVCEIRYNPDIVSERNHRPQTVDVRVVEVQQDETPNCNNARLLRCDVIAEEDPRALPYGCQWCLSGCVAIEE
ncbi:MAG: hypothetical protein ACK2UY_07380 [Anaerolineae bacterium]